MSGNLIVPRPSDSTILAMWEEDNARGTVRRLTPYEEQVWGATLLRTGRMMPLFAHAVDILHPMADSSCETSYVTHRGRVGLSYNFLYVAGVDERMFMLLHEAFHLLYRHFDRGGRLDAELGGYVANVCGDFEINSALCRAPAIRDHVDVAKEYAHPSSMGWIEGLTFEQYLAKWRDEKPSDEKRGRRPATGEDGPAGHGQGAGGRLADGLQGGRIHFEDDDARGGDRPVRAACDERDSEAKDAAADAAGVPASSNNRIENMRDAVEQDLRDARAAGRGMSSHGLSDEFIEAVLTGLAPPKVPWQKVLSRLALHGVSSRSRGYKRTTWERPNRHLADVYDRSGFISHSTYNPKPRIVVAVDTSGSMGSGDRERYLSEIAGILRSAACGGSIAFFTVSTSMSAIKTVASVNDLDLRSGGGTDMALPFRAVREQMKAPGERPDLMVLFTDGFVAWKDTLVEASRLVAARKSRVIILVTDSAGYREYERGFAGSREFHHVDVIDISQ